MSKELLKGSPVARLVGLAKDERGFTLLVADAAKHYGANGGVNEFMMDITMGAATHAVFLNSSVPMHLALIKGAAKEGDRMVAKARLIWHIFGGRYALVSAKLCVGDRVIATGLYLRRQLG